MKTTRPVFGKKPAPVAPVIRRAAGFFTAAEMAAIAEAREWIGHAAPLDLNHVREIARR
jgi:hypothetical protein